MIPYISIILPCYNVAEYLPDCMNSLEKQTIGITNLEMIFVDDASTDNGKTWEKILAFEEKYPDNVVAVRLESNKSQGGARNVGLAYARADYIGYLDPDDWIDPNMYLKLYTKAIAHQCDVVDCRTVMAFPNGKLEFKEPMQDRWDEKQLSIVEGGEHWIDSFEDSRYGGGIVTGIYRKELLQQAGVYFPENMKYEDNYWVSILLLYIKRYYHLAEDLYYYRQRMSSTMHGRNKVYHFDRFEIEKQKVNMYKKLQLFDKYHDKIERDFLTKYYVNTLLIMWKGFDEPSVEKIYEMKREIMELFPNYRENPYIIPNSLSAVLIDLMDANLSQEVFMDCGREVLRYMVENTP